MEVPTHTQLDRLIEIFCTQPIPIGKTDPIFQGGKIYGPGCGGIWKLRLKLALSGSNFLADLQ